VIVCSYLISLFVWLPVGLGGAGRSVGLIGCDVDWGAGRCAAGSLFVDMAKNAIGGSGWRALLPPTDVCVRSAGWPERFCALGPSAIWVCDSDFRFGRMGISFFLDCRASPPPPPPRPPR